MKTTASVFHLMTSPTPSQNSMMIGHSLCCHGNRVCRKALDYVCSVSL